MADFTAGTTSRASRESRRTRVAPTARLWWGGNRYSDDPASPSGVGSTGVADNTHDPPCASSNSTMRRIAILLGEVFRAAASLMITTASLPCRSLSSKNRPLSRGTPSTPKVVR